MFGKSTRGNRLISSNRIIGALPFVTAGETNEGISDFIGNNVIVYPKNTITIDMFGSAKYRNYKYGADDHVAVVDTTKITKQAAIFVTSAIHKSSYTGKFDYGRNFYAKDADELIISLPTKNNNPDYAFMDSFIGELEAEKIAELDVYLDSNSLKDTTLTNDEQQALTDFENLKFEDFKVTDFFHVENSKNILSRDIVENSGESPYLCASSENNAVSSYISYDEKYLHKGDCIFIGGKTFVVSYQEKDFFSNDSHNLLLYLKSEEKRSKLNQLYLVTCINKSLGHKYSWGDSISNKKIQKDKVSLPAYDNQLDFKSMAILMSAIQKLVIKDIVQYIDNSMMDIV